jgi:hypothetical protein
MARIKVLSVDAAAYRKLLKLDREIKRLTEERDQLKEELLPSAMKFGGRVVLDGVVFEVLERANYEFSGKVAELSAMLKARKTYEIERKIAKAKKPTEYFKITEVAQ